MKLPLKIRLQRLYTDRIAVILGVLRGVRYCELQKWLDHADRSNGIAAGLSADRSFWRERYETLVETLGTAAASEREYLTR